MLLKVILVEKSKSNLHIDSEVYWSDFDVIQTIQYKLSP